MGYYSTFRGHLNITSNQQPYPQELIVAAANAKYKLEPTGGLPDEVVTALNARNSNYSRFFNITPTSITAVAGEKSIVPENLVQDLIHIITQTQATANGELVRVGEEQGDLERYTITDNTITVDIAKLVWETDNTPVPYHYYEQ